MANVGNIWLFKNRDDKPDEMTVFVQLKPSGEVQLHVKVPKEFKDCIMEIAQTAADHHEAKMKASILAEKKET